MLPGVRPRRREVRGDQFQRLCGVGSGQETLKKSCGACRLFSLNERAQQGCFCGKLENPGIHRGSTGVTGIDQHHPQITADVL